jgi:putative isomerase
MKPARHWNTWDASRPAAMRHLPTGIRLTPLLYAASTGKASLIPPSPNVKLGTHSLDGADVSLTITHANTTLDWYWTKPDDHSTRATWTTRHHGEWGLRFWVTVILSCDAPGEWEWREGAAHFGTTRVTPQVPPLLITAHDSIEAVATEFESHGYWYLASRATKGRVLALRFNLDEMPTGSLTATIAGPAQSIAPHLATPSPLQALTDIMGWNSTWDPNNARPYTSCSRNWDISKFGGFGIWLTDTTVNAMLTATIDEELAQENLAALRAHQTLAGNFPCLVTGHDAWPDRTQAPIVSLLVWLTHLRDGDPKWLTENYPALARNHAWWWATRDGNGNGILEYGSSDVGDGLYVGTKLAAKDESFMDNSPMHDEAHFIAASRTLDMEDVGLNCLLTLDAEILSLMAQKLGLSEEAQAHAATASSHRARIQTHFWDDKRQHFTNRLWSGKFADAITPTSFYPLLCGAADAAQTQALLKSLADPAQFGGPFGLPSVSRNHPSFTDNVYWRGRIWPILNWLVWLGLKRANAQEAATDLLDKSTKLFAPAWQNRLAPENFNATTGEGLDQPDTDSFYSWTALLPHMQLSGLIDVDPFEGWVCVNEGPDETAGPFRSPWGLISASRKQGHFRLTRNDGRVIFETRQTGRVRVDYRG